MEECGECEFDVLVPEVKRVTLALTLVSKRATKFKYSIVHDLVWSGEGEEYRTIVFKKYSHNCNSNVAITDRQVYFDNIYSDINFIQIKIVLIDSVMNWWYMIKMSFFLRLWSAVSVSLTNSSKRWNK